jgi:pyrroline-5-carboxylate reductase
LAFIGGGNMAAALIGGLTKRGLPASASWSPTRARSSCNGWCGTMASTTAADNASAVKDAEVVVLAVKPQQMRAVALGLAPTWLARRLPWSSRSPRASRMRRSRAGSDRRSPVVRTMPNRPALNGFGATGLYAPAGVGAANARLAEDHGGGERHRLGGTRIADGHRHGALRQRPAYFFLFMEALEAAAHERGLPNDVAHRLTLETAFGAPRRWRASRRTRWPFARPGDLEGRHDRGGARRPRRRRPSCYRRPRGGGRRPPLRRTRGGVRRPLRKSV